jgi:hypothetical protein
MIVVHDRWTELLICSNCGMLGSAHLSRHEKRTYDFNVETVPAGFKVVRLEFGDTFYCEACNRPADIKWPVVCAMPMIPSTITTSLPVPVRI